ncbi:flagellar biosynthetic protein FliR [Caldinitratiruptor microaerophilus]|uniref:Flagellar biosynthetic protein FliR n=1 Tax=Caldinitratiruptor microaerophilus TaxID=671077 RepID=A0AA35CJ77_9FIRM|nr:flagellar biosynthetic protein FliR [Caldinitratiruptor microaerophilus]BDG59368.1 flagellar biosynthetic protein FliR [Caldinitratiruptor microaerophilus]
MDVLGRALGQLDLFLLLFSRVIGLFVTAPVLGNPSIPAQLRVALAMAVALLALPAAGGVRLPDSLPALAPLALRELVIGMVLGFVPTLLLAAVQFAGEILDVDLGFSIVSTLDPLNQQPLPLLGNFQYLLALLFFLAVDGHHGLLLTVLGSFRLLPAGAPPGDLAGLDRHVLALAGEIFRLGLSLAAPVLVALFLTTVAIAVVGRAVPQMNVFVVGLPVKTGAGLALLAALVPLYAAAFRTLFERMLAQTQVALELLR